MTDPTEGAVKAACMVANCAAEIPHGKPYKTLDVAELIDREAVAPAVRELVQALDWLLQDSDMYDSHAKEVLAKYRHLLPDSIDTAQAGE